MDSAGASHSILLQVGDQLTTETDQSATFNAARIGKVTVSENSAVKLVQTRKGNHRIELEHGHLHAKVWAPPGYFGVETRNASIIDLGCEFDLSVDASGNGIVTVKSGWVNFEFQGTGLWVPEHYSMKFTAIGSSIPLRIDASEEFRARVVLLEDILSSASQKPTTELEQQIALAARNEDYSTLYTLLRRRPSLANGPLYPRLASILGVETDETHRQRLVRGDRSALAEWWEYLPRQPKQPRQWWWNWRDAF